ncbi:hypothetical protein LJC06_03740 [Bacteroidales bacterium OttesenSCG-928-I14]|nr:hypothetical protein [Bacteroidales bacterium OttesenSCG-928-I14]
MKRLSFILISILLAMSVWAQGEIDLNVNWTKMDSPAKGKRTNTSMFLTEENGIVYSLYVTGIPPEKDFTGNYFMKVNTKDGKTESLKVELKNEKKTERDFETTLMIGNEIYLFSSFNNKKQKKYYFFAETINKNPLDYNHDERLIAEIDYSKVKGNKIGDLEIVLSPDQSHILLSYSLLNKKGVVLRNGLDVLDKDLNLIWHRENDYPHIDKNVRTYQGSYVIDNNGNVYSSYRSYAEKNRSLYISYYPADGTPVQMKEIKLSDGIYALAEKLDINNYNQLVCAGYYSRIGNSSAEGVFSIVFGNNWNTIYDINETAFSNEFFTKGLSDKKAEKMLAKVEKGKDFDDDYSYAFNDIHFNENGSFYLTSEKIARTLVIDRRQGVEKKYYIYYYDDVYITNFDASGNMIWTDKIAKSQKLIGKTHFAGSYSIDFDDDGSVHLIYTETDLRLDRNLSNDTQPTYIHFDKNGIETYYDILSEDNDIRKEFSPILSRGLGNGRFLLYQVDYGPLIGSSILKLGIVNIK